MATVLVTGANRGIGLALVKFFLHKGDKVIGICRKESDELRQSGAIVIAGIDVSSEDGVAKLKADIGDEKIDILINNAGILEHESLGSIDYDTVMKQLLVNSLGPIRVSEVLCDNLGRGAKIAMITSRMGSIADNGSGGYYGYRMSKSALNAGAMSLAKDLRSKGVAVAILHPGFVQTDMVGGAGDISAEVSAQRLAQRIEELTMESSGTFWHSNGEQLPW